MWKAKYESLFRQLPCSTPNFNPAETEVRMKKHHFKPRATSSAVHDVAPTPEKPFACRVCGNFFKSKHSRNNHHYEYHSKPFKSPNPATSKVGSEENRKS